MDLSRYDSLNEKLRLCYNCLREELSQEDRQEIKQEVKEYKEEMNLLLKGV